MYLIDETTLSIEYRSFDNLNSAYLGFNWEENNRVSIGNSDQRTGSNSITAYIGTQTANIPIKLDDSHKIWPLVSE